MFLFHMVIFAGGLIHRLVITVVVEPIILAWVLHFLLRLNLVVLVLSFIGIIISTTLNDILWFQLNFYIVSRLYGFLLRASNARGSHHCNVFELDVCSLTSYVERLFLCFRPMAPKSQWSSLTMEHKPILYIVSYRCISYFIDM